MGVLSAAAWYAPKTVKETKMSEMAKPTIVLVHGAFADGSSWNKVIPKLEKDGYTVIAVQNPLNSYEADVATTKRAISFVKGPVVLVGHSYGGAVITGAGAGEPNVKSLVYIAAFGMDSGEPVAAAGEKFAPAPLLGALVPDAGGFLYVDRAKVHDVFCADIPEADAKLIAATQKPLHQSCFGGTAAKAAWKDVPAWYLVCSEDRAINPELERFYAKRMNAKTTEIKSSHVPFLSHPDEVVKIIEDAAK